MKKLKPEYKALANPVQMDQFCQGNGVLPDLEEIGEAHGYNYGHRKLDWLTHFRGHVLLTTTDYKSARDHAWAAKNDPLFQANGAAVDVSFSGLAQANKNRPIEPLMDVLERLFDAAQKAPHRRLNQLDKQTWEGVVGLFRRTSIFDATMLKLPPKMAKWAAENSENSASLKLQLRIGGQKGEFQKVMLTGGTGSDSPYLDDLLGDLDRREDQYFVFDGGYWDIQKFHRIKESGNHFVAKRGGNIQPRVVENLPLPEKPLQSGYEVLQDARVYLGDRTDNEFRMLRVRQTEGQEIVLLTDQMALSADQICLLYRYRWNIEIVFRYLKQLLQLDFFFSHDPAGVVRQILMALIVWAMLVLSNQGQERLSPKNLWRFLMAEIHRAIYDMGFRAGFEAAEIQME